MKEEIKREDYKRFFGRDAEYYIDEVEKLTNTDKTSFNVFAFLFGPHWMFYRKLYKEGFIVFGIAIAFNIFLESLTLLSVISSEYNKILWFIFAIFYTIILGKISNKMYVRKSQKTIREILDSIGDQEEVNRLLLKKGGVNHFYPILLVFISLMVLLIVIYIET